jgi:cyclic nucleotide gated channel
MAIAGLGLLLFALLIGNIQNFLQSLFRRSQEMQMRRYDVESWMRRRGLPEEMRKYVALCYGYSCLSQDLLHF